MASFHFSLFLLKHTFLRLDETFQIRQPSDTNTSEIPLINKFFWPNMKTISLGTDNIKYGTIFKTFIFRIIEIIEKKARFAASRNTKYYNFTFFVKLNIFFSCSTLRHPFLLSLILRKKDKHFEFYKFWIIACSKNSLISRKKRGLATFKPICQ